MQGRLASTGPFEPLNRHRLAGLSNGRDFPVWYRNSQWRIA